MRTADSPALCMPVFPAHCPHPPPSVPMLLTAPPLPLPPRVSLVYRVMIPGAAGRARRGRRGSRALPRPPCRRFPPGQDRRDRRDPAGQEPVTLRQRPFRATSQPRAAGPGNARRQHDACGRPAPPDSDFPYQDLPPPAASRATENSRPNQEEEEPAEEDATEEMASSQAPPSC